MYLQCKHGFVEVDRLDDGARVPDKAHQSAIDKVKEPVVVVRSRRAETLFALLGRTPLKSTASWDYEFRLYVSVDEWAMAMVRVALDLDYRNFKSWTKTHAPEQIQLAHDIWEVAAK